MKLISTAFSNQQAIPDKYTCKGADINPPLQFLEVPDLTQSLVLIVDDPDAPGGTWDHWIIFNMGPLTLGIEENNKPSLRHDSGQAIGKEGINSWGKNTYGGPCPPSGTHRYFFKLFALDTLLDLPESVDKKTIQSAMEGHILDKAELVGLFSQ